MPDEEMRTSNDEAPKTVDEETADVVDDASATPVSEDVELAQRIFDCERDPSNADARAALMAIVEGRNMVATYTAMCERFAWPSDVGTVERMTIANAERLKAIEAKIEDARENLGDVEVRDAMHERATFYATIGSCEKAVEAFEETEGKTTSAGQKLDGAFSLMRMRLGRMELNEVRKLIEKIKDMLEQPGGGDWERKNRLKVYEGLHAAATRNFELATKLFLDSLSTFASYELMTYDDFVFYAVICAVVTLPRTELKAKVIDSPEVLSVLNRLPGLGDFLNALHRCDYRTFMAAFPVVAAQVESNVWLSPHYRYFLREVRVVAYAQYLQSYKSVTVKSMADSFNVSEDFIDRELSHFIVAGRLNCKIDKVSGVLQTNRPDLKNSLYQTLIKDGDALLNNVSKLSRVIDL
ncbi:putative proteasome regulatory subunit [Ostreococcus tauri]|uniref:26S proteasome regulatory subunit RPN7 n=1 Tax=Ostreococcus tauri TaxID=70448 RepID=A0A1Y5IL78_OSTTA|nr:putative proteasome regulatory subunit [Ostreococcus tauri]